MGAVCCNGANSSCHCCKCCYRLCSCCSCCLCCQCCRDSCGQCCLFACLPCCDAVLYFRYAKNVGARIAMQYEVTSPRSDASPSPSETDTYQRLLDAQSDKGAATTWSQREERRQRWAQEAHMSADSLYSPSSGHPPSQSQNSQMQHRAKVVRELIETERAYIDSLRAVEDIFELPMREQQLMQDGRLDLIFGQLRKLRNINEAFLSDLLRMCQPTLELLRDRGRKMDARAWYDATLQLNIAAVFVANSKRFREYATFVNQYEALTFTLAEKKKKGKVKAFLAEANKDPRLKGVALEGQLVKPIQRLPRYALLLMDFIRHMEESHPHYQTVVKALDEVEGITNYCNERKRDFDNIHRVIELQDIMDVPPGPHNRRLIKEGAVQKAAKSDRTRLKHADLMLFTDVIALHRSTRVALRHVTDTIPLEEPSLEVRPVPNTDAQFAIHVDGRSDVVLQAPNEMERGEWVHVLQTTIAAVHAAREEEAERRRV